MNPLNIGAAAEQQEQVSTPTHQSSQPWIGGASAAVQIPREINDQKKRHKQFKNNNKPAWVGRLGAYQPPPEEAGHGIIPQPLINAFNLAEAGVEENANAENQAPPEPPPAPGPQQHAQGQQQPPPSHQPLI